jgi:hypothetical protein
VARRTSVGRILKVDDYTVPDHYFVRWEEAKVTEKLLAVVQ